MPDWGDFGGLVDQLLSTGASPSASPSASPGGVLPPGFDQGGGAAPAQSIDWSFMQYLVGGPATLTQIQEYLKNTGRDISQALTPGPESQLSSAILAQIMKGGFHDEKRAQYYANQAAARAQNDSAYRQQLADWLGWDKTNSQVKTWVTTGGSIPVDPTSTGKGIATGGQGAGVTGSGAAPTDPSASPVQDPFPSQYFNNPNYQGNNYGDPKPAGVDWGGWQWHQGQDYGVPQGTPLSFPFAGKVVKVGYDPNGYGNYVTVEFGDSGLQMTYAHLSYVQVQDGDTITPGQQVGLSGGDQPGGGISTGHHLLVVLQDARGNPIDPRPLLNSIYSGTTLGQLQKAGVASTGTTGATGSYTTPDGHVIWPGTPDDSYYSMISQVYEHYYGTKPPWSMAMALKQAGVTNTDQLAVVAGNWPSDIPGVSFLTRENIYNTANGIAMKNWGRPIPDSLVKQLATQGMVGTDDIKEWFDTHIPTDIPAADYQQIYDAANPLFNQTYGEPPNPAYVGYLWGQNQAPVTPTGGTSAATTPPVTSGGVPPA